MAISDETLALAIPPELKTDHPDAALVVQGILIAIAANENSGGLSAKGRMRDTFAALQSVYVPIFQAHIAKEDEDWAALRNKAQKYVPTIRFGPPVKKRGRSEFSIMEDGTEVGIGKLYGNEAEGFAVSIPNIDIMQRKAEENGDTPGAALYAAVVAAHPSQTHRVEYDGAWGAVERGTDSLKGRDAAWRESEKAIPSIREQIQSRGQ